MYSTLVKYTEVGTFYAYLEIRPILTLLWTSPTPFPQLSLLLDSLKLFCFFHIILAIPLYFRVRALKL